MMVVGARQQGEYGQHSRGVVVVVVEGLERAENALKRVIIRGGIDIGLLGCGWSKLLGRFKVDMRLPNGYATFLQMQNIFRLLPLQGHVQCICDKCDLLTLCTWYVAHSTLSRLTAKWFFFLQFLSSHSKSSLVYSLLYPRQFFKDIHAFPKFDHEFWAFPDDSQPLRFNLMKIPLSPEGWLPSENNKRDYKM